MHKIIAGSNILSATKIFKYIRLKLIKSIALKKKVDDNNVNGIKSL
jgi:hypothetical protein